MWLVQKGEIAMARRNETGALIDSLWEAKLSGKPGQRGNKSHVGIWLRDDFHCVYCNADLLADRISLYSAQFDHLLPQKLYGGEFKVMEDNLVLSCFCCNQIKGQWNPASELGGDIEITPQTLGDFREELIEICREKLSKPLTKLTKTRNDCLKILSRA